MESLKKIFEEQIVLLTVTILMSSFLLPISPFWGALISLILVILHMKIRVETRNIVRRYLVIYGLICAVYLIW